MSRRVNDFYPTPPELTEALLRRLNWPRCLVAEPCAGNGAMSDVLKAHGFLVLTGDIDSRFDVQYPALDYLSPVADTVYRDAHAVITNPPFKLAPQFVRKSLETAPRVAMLLRLSFLELCNNRKDIVPLLSRVIVLPRVSFTGDGRKDNSACAWFIWEPGSTETTITWVEKEELGQ